MKISVFGKKLASQPGKKFTSEEFSGHGNVPVLYCVPLDHMYVYSYRHEYPKTADESFEMSKIALFKRAWQSFKALLD